MTRKAYASDVTDEEWAFVAPYLTLMKEDAPQREHDLREVFHAVRWIVRTGPPWRLMPHALPPWEAVYQQSQRWIGAGVFEAIGVTPFQWTHSYLRVVGYEHKGFRTDWVKDSQGLSVVDADCTSLR